MTPTLLHHLLDEAERRFPDAVAITCGTRAATYRQVAGASRDRADRLRRYGVRRGDRVVLVMPSSIDLVELVWACSRVGAAFVVLHHEAPPVTVAHVLDDCEPALLVTADPALRELAGYRGIACADGLPDRPGAPGDGGGEPAADELACLIYTSGSTGMPKAVVSPHAPMVFAASAIQSRLRYRSSDVVFTALPLSFDYGLYQVFLCAMAGARLHLAGAADTGRQLPALLLSCAATVLPAVPQMASGLARMLGRPGVRPPRLRLITNTGAAMPASVLADLRARIPGLSVQLMFGLTECKRATIMPADEDLRRPGACGRALDGTEVLIVDENGRRLPVGSAGQIVVRGPNVMAGYWRRPQETATRFPIIDGVRELHTGDYGRLDEDGYLYFEGRRDDIYKERGFRVSVTEVEAAACRIPRVATAAVLPPTATESAVLVAVTDLAPDEVIAAMRDQIEAFKIPRRCVVVPELPLTANGKVDRRRIIAMLPAGAA